MKKKERIAQLEKEVEELKRRIEILEMIKVIGVSDNPNPYLPQPYILPSYPWTSPPNMPTPIITWQYVPDTKTSIL